MEIITMKVQQLMMLSNNGSTDSTSGNLAPEYDFDNF